MEANLERFRILADAMTYLDRAYCRGSIIDWVRNSPEGAAYSIVRRVFIELVDEQNKYTNPALRAA
jgi:hypothetical protein